MIAIISLTFLTILFIYFTHRISAKRGTCKRVHPRVFAPTIVVMVIVILLITLPHIHQNSIIKALFATTVILCVTIVTELISKVRERL